MKKLFLLTALFVAAAFPSCSKHDNEINEPPVPPETTPLDIAFAEGNSLQFDAGETKTVHYTITGGSDKTVVTAEMQTLDDAYMVETTPTSATEGTITITAKTPTDNCVIVTVSDGSQTLTAEIAVSTKPNPEELAITFAEGNSLLLNINEPRTIHYTITGGSGNTVVQAEMQNPNGAYTVETTPTSATEGTITITAKKPSNENRIIVTVSDGSQTLTAEIAVTLRAFDGKTVVVVTPGTLSQLLADYDESSITELTVIGNLNDEDIATLKSLPNLAILDMEHVNLKVFPVLFYEKTSLISVKLPLTLKTIGDFAFYHCYSLTNVTIPNSVTEIGFHTFSVCSRLTSITIPDNVTSIGDSAFFGCSRLISVTIPNSVTEIENDAFYACSSLTSVTIPNSVMTIGERAFSGCSGLKSVTIPDSVTEIGYHAFYNCSSLSAFYGRFASSDNRCLIIDNKLIAFTPVGLTAYTIPDSVTTIGNYVFTDCVGLTSITIPDNVTEIEYAAFSGCSSLTSVTIPDSVTLIDENAFHGCSGLTNVTIGNSVKYIGNYAFDGCSGLTSVTIGNSVTFIDSDAFRGCSGLTSVYCKAIVPPIAPVSWSNIKATATLYVPTGSKAAYAAAAGWKNFKTIAETQF